MQKLKTAHVSAALTLLLWFGSFDFGCGRSEDPADQNDWQRDGSVDTMPWHDARPDGDFDTNLYCTPGELRCLGAKLQICLNGSFADKEDCAFGCSEQPTAHCGIPVWSNQVTTDDMEAGIEEAELQPGEVVVNTDQGLISGPGAPVAVPVRFVDRSNQGLPDLAIFSFASLRIRSGCHVRFQGSAVPIFVARRDISIEGTLDVSADTAGRPGPGGYPGGTAGSDGAGPGAGRGGSLGPLRVQEGGGGGAGFGGRGGQGADTATAAGGQAGSPYGNPKLDPLVGGSGGGSGAEGDSSQPGVGGAGAGAVGLMSLTRVQVLTEGRILANGGGGLGGGPGDAGGGGGSGGAILLAAPEVRILGVIAANGGAGGGADTDPPQDGAPGGAGDQPAQPGSGGGQGGAGNVPDGTAGQEASLHGGGGGGAVGRIRIESTEAPILGGILSPAPGTAMTSMVPLPVE